MCVCVCVCVVRLNVLLPAQQTMPPKFSETAPIITQGSLLKRGWWISSYKERWFILQERNLFYFAEPQDPPLRCGAPTGYIELVGAQLERPSNDRAVILIKTPDRTWELRAESNAVADKWFGKISAAQRGEYLFDNERFVVRCRFVVKNFRFSK